MFDIFINYLTTFLLLSISIIFFFTLPVLAAAPDMEFSIFYYLSGILLYFLVISFHVYRNIFIISGYINHLCTASIFPGSLLRNIVLLLTAIYLPLFLYILSFSFSLKPPVLAAAPDIFYFSYTQLLVCLLFPFYLPSFLLLFLLFNIISIYYLLFIILYLPLYPAIPYTTNINII